MKKNRLSGYLDAHSYPGIFYRQPCLVRLIFAINFIMTLRNWYVAKEMKKIEEELNDHLNFLDAGCGMGEFAIGVANRHPEAQVMGTDFTESNIHLANILAKNMKLKNITFEHGDLTQMTDLNKYDLILCNSTLQFIEQDVIALRNINNALKIKGKLLIYVPIRYKRYFPFFEAMEKKYLSDYYYKYHDDFIMHRYNGKDISDKVAGSGLNIISSKYAYSALGAVAFEMYSILLTIIKRLPIILSVPCIIIYIITVLPIQLILMLFDFMLPHSNGNGMLVVAEKV
jgi:ubiquinone/menaquinone biosynthesis C-methylase UbiE